MAGTEADYAGIMLQKSCVTLAKMSLNGGIKRYAGNFFKGCNIVPVKQVKQNGRLEMSPLLCCHLPAWPSGLESSL